MKQISRYISSLFFPFLVSGCVFAQEAPPSCFYSTDTDAYVLVGTDELPLISFRQVYQYPKGLYINDTGGSEISIRFDPTSKPNRVVITYNEPGMDIIEKSQDITCSFPGQTQTESINLIKVSDGLLVKTKPGFINQFPYEGWIFLKKT